MNTAAPKLTDIFPAEELANVQANTEQIAIDLIEEKLMPILRKATGYKGEVTVTAKNTLTLGQDEQGNPLLKNDIALGLAFPTKSYADVFEEVNRTIFAGFFNEAVKRL